MLLLNLLLQTVAAHSHNIFLVNNHAANFQLRQGRCDLREIRKKSKAQTW